MYAVSIWTRGLAVNAAAAEALIQGGSSLDAVEAALQLSEDDVTDMSTGVGGLPNAAGEVELDAAIIHGPTGAAGAVGALKDTRYAISVARRVMEKTSHLLLVGEGAREFAREQGFPGLDLLTEESARRWREWREAEDQREAGHDTMGTIAIDQQSEVAVGVTTSGTAFKLPGRMGDSAVVGAGLYCDQEVGGALATGVGEEAMRVCATFLVVELMRHGEEPRAACQEALARVLDKHRRNPKLAGRHLSLAALRVDGRAGGASLREGFAYAYFDGERNRLVKVSPMNGGAGA